MTDKKERKLLVYCRLRGEESIRVHLKKKEETYNLRISDFSELQLFPNFYKKGTYKYSSAQAAFFSGHQFFYFYLSIGPKKCEILTHFLLSVSQ